MASMDLDRKKALGRGLASLIPEVTGTSASGTPVIASAKKEYFQCDIEKLVPNTYQPRKIFDKEALDELVESVRVHGILQPIAVRQKGSHYEIIAGERRWRAAQRAGLQKVPVIVKEAVGDGASLELAIIENIQRENLNCIEEAIAFQQLIEEFNLSQDEVAQRVGKSRAAVTNTLRLLRLPAVIREDLTSGKLSMGHARALLGLEKAEDQLQVREWVIRKKLSVRDTERKVQEILKAKEKGEEVQGDRNPLLVGLEQELKRKLQTPTRVFGSMDRGFLQINYSSQAELTRITDIILGNSGTSEIGLELDDNAKTQPSDVLTS